MIIWRSELFSGRAGRDWEPDRDKDLRQGLLFGAGFATGIPEVREVELPAKLQIIATAACLPLKIQLAQSRYSNMSADPWVACWTVLGGLTFPFHGGLATDGP